MMYKSLVRGIGPALCGAIAVVSVSRPAGAQDKGMTYDMVSGTSMDPALVNMAQLGSTMHVTMAPDGKYRMDVISAPAVGPYQAGDYLLMSEGRMLIVHPAARTYTDMLDATNAMLKTIPAELRGDSASINAIVVKVDTISTNEVWDGRSAFHVRFTYTMAREMMGHKMAITSASDYWFVKFSATMQMPPGTSILPAARSPAAGGMAEAVRSVMAGQIGAVVAKMVITSTVDMSDFGGAVPASPVTTMTTEMKNVVMGPIDAALLVMPVGYVKVVN